jgi:hypothetical protein
MRNYSATFGRVGRYKFVRTSDFDGAISIFIYKRLFGFLWWVFVKDKFNLPICFNKMYHAEAFMNDKIKYDDRVDEEYKWVGDICLTTVHVLTDEKAKDRIVQKIFDKSGEVIDPDIAKAAWILDGKQYIHRAVDYADLWNTIYKFNGKKLWKPLLNNQ